MHKANAINIFWSAWKSIDKMQQLQICRKDPWSGKTGGGVAGGSLLLVITWLKAIDRTHNSSNMHMCTGTHRCMEAHTLKYTDSRKSGLLNSHYHDNLRTEWPSVVNCGIDFVPCESGAELCLLIWPQLSVSLFLLDVSFSPYCYTAYISVCVDVCVCV